MNQVRAKKNLGQHFLTDLSIARKICDAYNETQKGKVNTIEIGPGMGVLSQYLLQREDLRFKLIEIDGESVEYLKEHF